MTDPRANVPHLKSWQLGLIFVLGLAVFVLIRWQPEPWLKAEMLRLAEQQHLRLAFSDLTWSGSALEFKDVRIGAARMTAPLELDDVVIRPAWSALWSGEPGIRATLIWHGQRWSAMLRWDDAAVALDDIEGAADLAALQPLWRPQAAMLPDMQGKLEVRGSLRLDRRRGKPLGGGLTFDLAGAQAALAGMKIPLGDYRLSLQASDKPDVWRWKLEGGEGLVVHGDGELLLHGDRPEQWRIDGRAEASAGAQAGKELAMMLGGGAMKVRVFGPLLRPQWERL